MKKVICLAAVLALAATTAFGQSDDGSTGKTAVYHKPTNSQDPEVIALADMLRKELDSNRNLERVEVYSDQVMELDAPLKMTKDAAGKKLTVTFEIAPARGSDRAYTVTCNATQVDRCADAIVLRVERVARDAESDKRAGAGME